MVGVGATPAHRSVRLCSSRSCSKDRARPPPGRARPRAGGWDRCTRSSAPR